MAKNVYPVHKNKFKIGGLVVAQLENFGPTFDNGVEEWYAMEDEGWIERLLTSKGWSIDFSGKRAVGDEGSDFVASKFMAIGEDAVVPFEWEMIDGSTLESDVVIEVTNIGGGDTTNVAPLEFSIKSKGKPKLTLAV